MRRETAAGRRQGHEWLSSVSTVTSPGSDPCVVRHPCSSHPPTHPPHPSLGDNRGQAGLDQGALASSLKACLGLPGHPQPTVCRTFLSAPMISTRVLRGSLGMTAEIIHPHSSVPGSARSPKFPESLCHPQRRRYWLNHGNRCGVCEPLA